MIPGRVAAGGVAAGCAVASAAVVALSFSRRALSHSAPPRIVPAALEWDAEGAFEVYEHSESFAAAWAERTNWSDPCWRTDDWHGVPFSVESAGKEELDVDALTDYLLSKESEWMALPIRGWKDEDGPAYNTTSARFDQYNVLTDADSVPVVGALKRLIKRAARNYLVCVATCANYFAQGSPIGDYFAPILRAIEPQTLYIMCWVNVFRHDRQHANSLHWHIHHWPFQGYLSVTSEGSGTVFRSNVHTDRRWRFEHRRGMLFLLPGGTLHASTPWTRRDTPRITVAFNLAPAQLVRPDDPARFHKWVWEELITADEATRWRAAGERWAMIVQRPPIPYLNCMVNGDGVCAATPTSGSPEPT